MNQSQKKPGDLLETTDCLEAVGVFRAWKNFFFLIAILSLLVLQIGFWLVDTGVVKASAASPDGKQPANASAESNQADAVEAFLEPGDEVGRAAVIVTANEANQPPKAGQQAKKHGPFFGIKVTFKHLKALIRVANFVLILTAVLYCLTVLFCLKVSLLGRLGGINHISRAFFLSLIAMVLVMPWQRFFGGVIAGVIFIPEELLASYAEKNGEIFNTVLYYLRFSGYWFLLLLIMGFSQLRTGRWAKATLRRLEVI